jgi:hypothetical protein
MLFHGAAGGVGTAALQLGSLAGLEMFVTASKAAPPNAKRRTPPNAERPLADTPLVDPPTRFSQCAER